MDAALAKELTRAGRRAAALVAKDAKQRAPKRSGNLARSVRPRASAQRASVVAGNDKVPYARVIEFGGTIPVRGKSGKRRPVKKQPYLYPAIRAKSAEIAGSYQREVDEVVRKAGF